MDGDGISDIVVGSPFSAGVGEAPMPLAGKIDIFYLK
jgi:hypothetical protein